MTMRTEILERMTTVICGHFDVPASAVHEGATFVEDFGADSLAVVELVLAFEENFGINIPDTDADKLSTVGDAVTYVIAHGGAVQARPSDAA